MSHFFVGNQRSILLSVTWSGTQEVPRNESRSGGDARIGGVRRGAALAPVDATALRNEPRNPNRRTTS